MTVSRHNSLTARLALPICGILLIAVGSIIAAQYFNNRRVVFTQVENAGVSLLEIVQETIIVSPELFGSEKLHDIILRVAQSTPGVQRISIADRSLTIIADSAFGRLGQKTDSTVAQDVLQSGQVQKILDQHESILEQHISAPILGAYDSDEKTNIVGVATIHMSMSAAQQELDYALLMLVVIVILIAVLIGASLYYFVRYLLIGPIHALNTSTQRFGRGDLAHKITVDRNDELGQLGIALNQMSSDLQKNIEQRKRAEEELVRKERLAAVGQVTATVSHELRNPLGAIRSASDAIRKLAGDDVPQMTRAIALLERSQVRCDKIISDLLNFTRVRELELTATRVDDWLEGIVAEHELGEDISLRRELDAPIEVTIDRDRLERAVRNVIDNACHAMVPEEEDGAVAKDRVLTVASRVAGGRLELSIKDTGAGIPAVDSDKVFEPLYSTKSVGVGLGLPMVKETLGQHGGGVHINSEPGRGTEVVLWLPLRASEQGAAA